MRIALVSLDQFWEDKDLNITACYSFLKRAKKNGVSLVIFPEMTLTAFSMNTNLTAENRLDSRTVELFKTFSNEFQLAIIFGVVFQDGDKALNNALLVDKTGEIKGDYSKIHPFSFVGEDAYFNRGREICAAKLDEVYIGITICYDLRFPEIYSALAKECGLIINIANWPSKRIDHWNTLLKARAIENQLFVIGVNRTGVDGKGLEYIKSSQVITPNGELLIPVISEDELDIYDIDLDDVNKFKKTFPTVQDRDSNLYKSIL
jgi:omega-amidase